MTWWLEVVRGPEAGRSWPIPDGAELVVGRDPAASTAVVRTPMVSRSHVAVRVHDGIAWLEDLGSMNGTWGADGRRLEPGVPASHEPGATFHLAHAGLALRVVQREAEG